MKKYQIAIIVSVKADSYEEALAEVSEDIDDVGALPVHDYEQVEVVVDYAVDNEGQRVIYLDSLDDTDDEEDEDKDEETAA